MDVFRTVVDRIRGEKSRLAIKRPIAPIPPVIAKRLIPDNPHEPLFPKLQNYGRVGRASRRKRRTGG